MGNYPDRISVQTLAAALALGGGSSPSPGKVYQFAGSVPFLGLPALSIDKVGNVYDVTDEFTSTADFTDGGGKHYSAGTNVAIANTGTDESPVLKYDCLMGDLSEILDDIDDLKDASAEYPIASTTTGINPSITDSADGLIQDVKVYGESRVSKNLAPLPTKGAYDNENGAYRADLEDNYVYSLCSVQPNTQYTAFVENIGSLAMYIVYFNGTPGTSTYISSAAYAYSTATITTPTGCTCLVIETGRSSTPETVGHVQLELSSEPTPYEPYGAIISIGDSGSLTITTTNSDSSESSTATLTTGLPYCGIPVTTGETYTDEQGQKWLADTADVEGVVKRCGVDDLGDFTWNYDSTYHRFYTTLTNVKDAGSRLTPMVCSTYTVISDGRAIQNIPDKSIYTVSITLYIHDSAYTDAADFKTAVTGVKLVYPLATPTTQELTTAEKSALRNLRTYNPITNVTVTDDPTVDVGYLLNTDNGQAVADAIDNAITSVLNTSY